MAEYLFEKFNVSAGGASSPSAASPASPMDGEQKGYVEVIHGDTDSTFVSFLRRYNSLFSYHYPETVYGPRPCLGRPPPPRHGGCAPFRR